MEKNIWNSFSALILINLLLLSCLSCSRQSELSSENQLPRPIVSAKDLSFAPNGLSYSFVTIKTVYGNIVFQFYPLKAPNTVTRILRLINDGFYDGQSFHRVIKNFLIQSGSPNGSEHGGSGKKLRAEFNDIQHIRGTIAMARKSGEPDSGDSQFYIALTTLPHLDRQYTVFAQVIDGLEILDQITVGDKILSMSFNLQEK